MAKTGLAMNKFSPRVVLTQQAAVRHRGESNSFTYLNKHIGDNLMKTSMAVMAQILRFLTSFAMSTEKVLVAKGETISLTRMNSSYKSHQGIEFGEGHSVSGLIVLKCKNDFLAVFTNNPTLHYGIKVYHEMEVKGFGYTVTELPSYKITEALKEFSGFLPEWVSRENLLYVVVPNRYRFDEETQAPMFDCCSNVTIGHRHKVANYMAEWNWVEAPSAIVEVIEEEISITEAGREYLQTISEETPEPVPAQPVEDSPEEEPYW